MLFPLLAPSSVYVGRTSGPCGHRFGSCSSPTSPTPPALPGGLLLLSLRWLQYASHCSPAPLHLFSTGPPGRSQRQRDEGVTCSKLEWLWLFLAGSKLPPALFSEHFTYSRPSSGVWPQPPSMDHLHLLPISAAPWEHLPSEVRILQAHPSQPCLFCNVFPFFSDRVQWEEWTLESDQPGFYSYNSITEYIIWCGYLISLQFLMCNSRILLSPSACCCEDQVR